MEKKRVAFPASAFARLSLKHNTFEDGDLGEGKGLGNNRWRRNSVACRACPFYGRGVSCLPFLLTWRGVPALFVKLTRSAEQNTGARAVSSMHDTFAVIRDVLAGIAGGGSTMGHGGGMSSMDEDDRSILKAQGSLGGGHRRRRKRGRGDPKFHAELGDARKVVERK